MRAKFLKEVAVSGLPSGPGVNPITTDADLAPLPAVAQRYLRFMAVVGRPRDWSLRMSFRGRFRTKLDGPWAPVTAWQYNSGLEVARIFHMRMRFGGVVPVLARDTYIRGHGRMLGKAFDLITVVDGSGPEFDIGELVTYLNDAINYAPSMLLGPDTSWTGVDDGSFDVSLTDRGTTVKARVFVDRRGAPTDFGTTDRFIALRGRPPVRARWTASVEFGVVNGSPVAVRGQAVWHLPEGDKPYAEFTLVPRSLAFNIPPGA
jgi:hypothetical protein